MKREEAYLTVHLTLCLAVILSLYLTLIEGVRRNGGGLEAACVADIGLQSIMAEYHRELFRQYNLFAIDSSYGTRVCKKANTEAHLRKYLDRNVSMEDVLQPGIPYRDFLALEVDGVEMTGVSILTDQKGAVFRRRAVEAIQDDVGLSALGQIQEWLEAIQVNGLDTGRTWEETESLDKQMKEFAGEDAGASNPLSRLEEKRRLGILRLTVGAEESLSQYTVPMDDLVMNRMRRGEVNQGNLEYQETGALDQLAERLFFQEYLMRYMECYETEHTENAGHALQYQIEYIIAGRENDTDNLRNVANRLCALREAANLIYLYSDLEKKAEVETLSVATCTLLLAPELAPALELAIMMGWAYAESIYDVKTLLAGGRIPLLKDKSSWHYGLQAALSGQLVDEGKDGQGLSYQDYLRVFLTLTSLDTMTGRAMNMVEADIRMTQGNGSFRLDGCYDRVRFEITMSSRYGYEYQIIREKEYD